MSDVLIGDWSFYLEGGTYSAIFGVALPLMNLRISEYIICLYLHCTLTVLPSVLYKKQVARRSARRGSFMPRNVFYIIMH